MKLNEEIGGRLCVTIVTLFIIANVGQMIFAKVRRRVDKILKGSLARQMIDRLCLRIFNISQNTC